jgi:hypothetical protein
MQFIDCVHGDKGAIQKTLVMNYVQDHMIFHSGIYILCNIAYDTICHTLSMDCKGEQTLLVFAVLTTSLNYPSERAREGAA